MAGEKKISIKSKKKLEKILSKRLDKIFQTDKDKPKLITFFTGCDPTYETSLEILKEAAKNGASILEIGYPTSEASAEGPIIKKSHDRVIAQKIGLPKTIRLAKDLRSSNSSVGIVLMGYISNVFMYSIPKFAKDIAGIVDGVLCVDAPHEIHEENELRNELKKYDIDLIKLIAPTSGFKRIEEIANLSSGFIYSVNVKGITGVKKADVNEVSAMIKKIKSFTKTPIVSGFGIKTPEDAKLISKSGCMGIVIGSTLVDFIEKNINDKKLPQKIGKIVKEFNDILNI